ncbi:MAG TPA: sulfate adenylyltransferase subunit CysN [Candidatus Angelobacter sp.]|nr:sulfate adenylyltransferase subunit CysN [Candidatus Angelobacter sp.]
MTAPILCSSESCTAEANRGWKDLLRFTTAGSVDDGKSTMIGRLLYDAKSVYEDQLQSIQKSGINRADGPIDFSLLTDGLRAEREQGITIDVAYRYFSTAKRKFIIADTPGHEQYTRNMVTGASTADAAVILIDARKGLLAQSRRHAYIASLLGIQHIIAAVNKMDLVEYREDVFQEIADDFKTLADRLAVRDLYALPISALKGDGVVVRGGRMEWFEGPPLLEYLENLPGRREESGEALRLPIQYVIRPNSDFRGFAGQVVSGQLRTGSKVIALPSFMPSRVKSIVTFDGEVASADTNSAVTFTLQDEIDLSRGDWLVNEDRLPQTAALFVANLVWMHSGPSAHQQEYLLKHTTRTVRARLRRIIHRVDVNTLDCLGASALQMNDIAVVEIETTKPLLFDPYGQNRTTGSFILIDPLTNATVAAGMIQGPALNPSSSSAAGISPLAAQRAAEVAPQSAKHVENKRVAAAIWLVGNSSLAENLEHRIQQNGWPVQLLSTEEFVPAELRAIATVLKRRGVVTIVSLPTEDPALKEAIDNTFGDMRVLTPDETLGNSHALSSVLDWLHDLQTRSKREGPGFEHRPS